MTAKVAEYKQTNLALKKAEKAVARRYGKRAVHALEGSPMHRSRATY